MTSPAVVIGLMPLKQALAEVALQPPLVYGSTLVTPPFEPFVFKLIGGMSALTSARNVGNAAAPLEGPAKTRFAACVPNWGPTTGPQVGPALSFTAVTTWFVQEPTPDAVVKDSVTVPLLFEPRRTPEAAAPGNAIR